jgi:hypothetical protein
LPKVPYEQYILTYVPEFPGYLCTSTLPYIPSHSNYFLFNFCNVKNPGPYYPGVRVYGQNESNTLFEIDRSTNNIHVGTFDETSVNGGTVKIGGNDLQLYLLNCFKLKNLNQTNTITSDTDNFKISSSSGQDVKIAYGM